MQDGQGGQQETRAMEKGQDCAAGKRNDIETAKAPRFVRREWARLSWRAGPNRGREGLVRRLLTGRPGRAARKIEAGGLCSRGQFLVS